jgi:hypothetical protein
MGIRAVPAGNPTPAVQPAAYRYTNWISLIPYKFWVYCCLIFSKFIILNAAKSYFRRTSFWQPKIWLTTNRFVLTLPARLLKIMKSNRVISFESPCGRHSSSRSMFYWKRISKSVEMEQRDLQRFRRTSKRELNNSKEKNCKTGAILYWEQHCKPMDRKERWKERGR